MQQHHKINYYLIGGLAFLLFLYLISGILLPFVVGILVAYLMDPVADRLERRGISRASSTSMIIGVFFASVITICSILLPMISEQIMSLAAKIPHYLRVINESVTPKVYGYLSTLDSDTVSKIQSSTADVSSYLLKMIGELLSSLWSSGKAILNVLSLILISPIVAFYLLRDWDKIITKIDSWLPRRNAAEIKAIFKDIDTVLAGFIRGQGTVMLLLGTFYAFGLTVIGVESSLFIGFGTGLLTILPYIGVTFGMIVGLTVTFFQFGDIPHLAAVAAVFAAGQFLEGNFITPKLVGDKVGLHPVWIIFGMLAGGSLFGFVGILIAIPATAVIGVLSRFAIKKYLESAEYKKPTPARKRKK